MKTATNILKCPEIIFRAVSQHWSAIRFLNVVLVLVLSGCSEKEAELPAVLTAGISDITTTSAKGGGDVVTDGGGEVTSRGVCWNTATGPTINDFFVRSGSGAGQFESSLTNLVPGTLYFVRAFAMNKAGTSYGFEVSFSTVSVTPSLTTTPATDITTAGASSGGIITTDGGYSVTSRGVCWSTEYNPTLLDPHTDDGSGTGSFTSCITGLEPGTSYYVRAYATNSQGTAYGYQIVFSTFPVLGPIVFNPDLTYGTVEDIEGNIYRTIEIGTQTWMAENLRTTKFNDGTDIHYVPAGERFPDQIPAFCTWYNGFYGNIYNFYTVETGKICPEGWRVPSHEDLETLVDYLGGWSVAGGKLKESGTTHWKDQNIGATNSSGYTALPGGYAPSGFGAFSFVGTQNRSWLSVNGDIYILNRDSVSVDRMSCMASCGMTIRCIKE